MRLCVFMFVFVVYNPHMVILVHYFVSHNITGFSLMNEIDKQYTKQKLDHDMQVRFSSLM